VFAPPPPGGERHPRAAFSFRGGTVQPLEHDVERKGLLDEIECPHLDRLEGDLDGSVPGNHQNADLWIVVAEPLERFDAVHAAGHGNVKKDKVGGMFPNHL